ncbi:hypothetical protein DV738_g41, partial [Chaetothyriales sp. CBS 135597]
MPHSSNLPRSTFYGGAPSQNRNVSQTQQAHKRNFGTAFGGAQSQSRPQAPPAVPSFSAGLDNEGPESEDDGDGDEEAKLATPGGLSSAGIQFEYKGNVSTLSTPADIAAWIAERRKRYPTQAKREAAQKEAEARKEEIAQERKARQEAQREKRERERKERTTILAGTNQARLRAEKLRRKLEKAERALAAMDESSKAGTATKSTTAKRKGLWDVLVEKELEEENKKVLQAIIALGDAGMFEEEDKK